MFICLRPNTIFPPFPLTHHIGVYSTVYFFTQERGTGGELNQREGERSNRGEYTDHTAGLKIPT